MIEAKKVSLKYDEVYVVKEFNTVIKKGEIVSLIGPNGSGKTTVLRAMSRLMDCSKGSVYMDGKDINSMPSKKVAGKLCVLTQHHIMPPDFTVEELVSYGRVPHRHILGSTNQKDSEIIEWAMKETGVDRFRDRAVHKLSGGERQKVRISMALAQMPQILFLDEPTTYLDICHQLEIMELIKRLNVECGLTVLMVLHDINQAVQYSSRIIALKDGRLFADGRPEEIITKEMLRDVYRIEADVKVDKNTGKPYFKVLGLVS